MELFSHIFFQIEHFFLARNLFSESRKFSWVENDLKIFVWYEYYTTNIYIEIYFLHSVEQMSCFKVKHKWLLSNTANKKHFILK